MQGRFTLAAEAMYNGNYMAYLVYHGPDLFHGSGTTLKIPEEAATLGILQYITPFSQD